MKKSEVMQLLASKEAHLRVNPICTLRRWLITDAVGNVTDSLVLGFVPINGMGRFSSTITIRSRSFEGIKYEVEAAIRKVMQEATEFMCTALRNGYTI